MESCLLCLLRNCKVPDSSEMNRSLTDSGGAEISELFSTLKFKSLSKEIMSTQTFVLIFFFYILCNMIVLSKLYKNYLRLKKEKPMYIMYTL